ncbi:HD domain-containing protein [Mycolicibacterium vaccae]|uniref:HD domain-containing protein n=1 Tax=Mycolicibacterium vaccae TaxID=1810 RepID=UPI003CF5ADF8
MTLSDSTVASLDLPDTALAQASLALVSEVSAEFLLNHCVRSYLFGRELAAASGLRAGGDYDDELLFVACLLHDLGVTDHANGDQRFEVDGADAAAAFLREHHVDEARIRTVWNAVALHTSVGLAHRFGPLEGLAQQGIAADVVGEGRALLRPGFADRVHARWPRHHLGYALGAAIARQVQANPAKGAPLTLPALVHHQFHPDAPARGWFDIVESAGWGDLPPGTRPPTT